MTETYFYNSNNGDRLYSATSMENWLKKFFTTGVFSGDYQVTLSGAMTLSVGAGYANIDGKVVYSDAATTLSVSTADANSDRVDLVVVERNDVNRAGEVKMVTGTPGSGAPARTWTATVKQLVLAEVLVPAGSISVQAYNITDKRGDSTVCGYVAQAVQSFTFDQFAEQYNAWFEAMREQISDDDPVEALIAELVDLTPVDLPLTFEDDGWTVDGSGVYTQTIAASNITYEVDGQTVVYPLSNATEAYIDLDMSGATTATAAGLEEAWSQVGRVTVAAAGVTAYCYDYPPSVDLPCIMRVVKKR